MAEKVTIMVLKVDLQCPHCRKKIKKILSKFPQIRGQTYDEKHNTVTIKVVCCSPEKIRDKLCCRGGKTIDNIDISLPPKPKPQPAPEKPKQPWNPSPRQKPPPEKPEKPKEPEKPNPIVKPPNPPEKPAEKPTEVPKPDPPPKKPPPPMPEPVCAYPIGTCCGPCYEGRVGGPCYHAYHGYGVPPPPPPPGPC